MVLTLTVLYRNVTFVSSILFSALHALVVSVSTVLSPPFGSVGGLCGLVVFGIWGLLQPMGASVASGLPVLYWHPGFHSLLWFRKDGGFYSLWGLP